MKLVTLKECSEELINQTLDCVFNVHRELGPGFLESVYEKALLFELLAKGLKAESQRELPVTYKGHDLGIGFRADIIVEDSLLLEIKCVEQLTKIHLAQVINYLKLLQYKRGFLLNFNVRLMKQGTKRVSI
ncbi:MAG: GxxExxY protein [Gammaproteobacteria bacterium]